MQVFVTGRQGGKTRTMIDWLLQGEPIDKYPGWSRVIVCANTEQVLRLTHLVQVATAPYGRDDDTPRHIWDVRKCIWGLDDVKTGLRGAAREVEVGIDNAEYFLQRMLRLYDVPTFVTMTGELYDNVPHGTTEDGASPV